MFCINSLGLHDNLLNALKTIGTGKNGDGTGIDGATHQHAVDATLHGQDHSSNMIVRRILLTCCDTANPASLSHQREIDKPVVQRTATALSVDHLHLNHRHIGTISLHAFRILDGCQLQAEWLASGLQLIAATVRTNGLKGSGLVSHMVEGVQIVIRPAPLA